MIKWLGQRFVMLWRRYGPSPRTELQRTCTHPIEDRRYDSTYRFDPWLSARSIDDRQPSTCKRCGQQATG